jgi:hypothetical protein
MAKKELTQDQLEPAQIYFCGDAGGIIVFQFRESTPGDCDRVNAQYAVTTMDSSNHFRKYPKVNELYIKNRGTRLATDEEAGWLIECIKWDKYFPPPSSFDPLVCAETIIKREIGL